MIIACRYDAELYPIAAAQWEKLREQDLEHGLGTGLMLVVGSMQEALEGVSRERAVDLGRKALASSLPQLGGRIYLTSALAALAMAGEVDEAQAGLARVIAAAERARRSAHRCRSPALEGAACITKLANSCWPSRT